MTKMIVWNVWVFIVLLGLGMIVVIPKLIDEIMKCLFISTLIALFLINVLKK